MNLTDSFTLKCLCGCPVFLDDICAIFPATLKEIVSVGYDKFLQHSQIILLQKPYDIEDKDLRKSLEDLSDFEYFLLLTNIDESFLNAAKESFYFFIHENVIFSVDPAQIIVGPVAEKHIITEEKFYELRQIIKKMYFMDGDLEEISVKKNDNPQIAALKKRMLANREKVAKAKAKKANDGDMSLSDLIASLAIGQCGLNIFNIWDITYYAFHDQLKRMGWRDKFNINNRAALAGAKLKKSELKHWMRPIASEDKK